MYCEPYSDLAYLVFSSEAPSLLYYSHFPAIIVSLLLSFFILSQNAKNLSAKLLASISLVFSIWSVFDLFIWTQTDSRLLMFLWSYWFLCFALLFVLSLYFLYVFAARKDLPFSAKLTLGAGLLPLILLSSTPYNLTYFDVVACNASEGTYMLLYAYGFSVLVFASMIGLAARHYLKTQESDHRKRILFATVGISLFLLSFSLATLIASVSNFFESSPDTFEIEQYGYFGMTVFIALLTYVIVQYKAFNVKLIAAQALVASLIILIGSQFFFIRNPINYILNGITFALVIGFGYLLVRSVEREIAQRIQVQKLAGELERANKQQVILIHFITHQIKGFVTKSRNIFSMMREGDFGPVPENLKPMIEEGFKSDTKGVNTIQEILNAANIKSGKVEYKKEPFDLKALIDEITADLKGNADAKGLALNVSTGTEPLMYPGDRAQLINAFKNLIDNSIKYTPKGEVRVSLAKESGKVRFLIEDTGVGISKEDMARLFTEGGHGTNSAKINVESTGFGLYIVKNIIEAHGGKVWAESEGEGKGSRFVVELPV